MHGVLISFSNQIACMMLRRRRACCCCREKSCTREGIAALEEVIMSMEGAKSNEDAPKFSIVKLACCGVVMLRWERAASSPRPTQVATELISSVQQGQRQRLKCVHWLGCAHELHGDGNKQEQAAMHVLQVCAAGDSCGEPVRAR